MRKKKLYPKPSPDVVMYKEPKARKGIPYRRIVAKGEHRSDHVNIEYHLHATKGYRSYRSYNA